MAAREKRILIVEDEDAIRALLFTVLRRRGFKVDTALNGADALERCRRCRYSLVLLDLMMPIMSGYDFVESIADWRERPVVIVLTAGPVPKTLDCEVVVGTMRKPFDIELLVDAVTACMAAVDGPAQQETCPGAESEVSRERSRDRSN